MTALCACGREAERHPMARVPSTKCAQCRREATRARWRRAKVRDVEAPKPWQGLESVMLRGLDGYPAPVLEAPAWDEASEKADVREEAI